MNNIERPAAFISGLIGASDSRSGSGWRTMPLKYVSMVRPSNVDKKAEDSESIVKLCNYTDVYYQDTIDSTLEFMRATATNAEIERFQLRVGDVIITKDSETADDIAIPAYVSESLPNLLCGYHLAILRPNRDIDGRFLFWLLKAQFSAAYFETRANGITRYAVGLDTVGQYPVVVPPFVTQKTIARFLDKETDYIDALIKKKKRQIELL